MNKYIIAASVAVLYLLISHLLIGFKTDQLVLITIFVVPYLASSASRKFILGFSIFIVFWIIFDYMKAFPNYLYNEVHIQSLYEAELRFFGTWHDGILLTPNEFFKLHQATLSDVLAGIFYLSWVPVPLGFAAYLYFKNRSQFIQFSLTFLWVNLIGFTFYYLYPAAPPWYVQKYGFAFQAHTPGNTAGLIGFDHFFHVSIFQGLYSKSSNVFAAMPSLHAAYPMIVLYYGLKNKLGWINIIFATIIVGIWVSAVYTSHHYTLDILAGIMVCCVGIASFALLLRNKKFKSFIDRYTNLIS